MLRFPCGLLTRARGITCDTWPTGAGSNMPDRLLEPVKIEKLSVDSHLENFLRCVRTRETPRADIQAGFSHAVADCMAAAALESGRRIGFDPQRLEML